MPLIRPFEYSGVARDSDGILRYQTRRRSLVESFRAVVDRFPHNEALVELGGERVNYRDFSGIAPRG